MFLRVLLSVAVLSIFALGVAARGTVEWDTVPAMAVGSGEQATCDGVGRACPEAAMVWAHGSFTTHASEAALRHGGLELRLSLCCNYTFNEVDTLFGNAVPPYVSDRGEPQSPEHLRALVAAFHTTLFDVAPVELRSAVMTLFPPSAMSLSADRSTLTMVAQPLPKLKFARSLEGNETWRHVAFAVDRAVLRCQCPRSLRVKPRMDLHDDVLPPLGLVGGGHMCGGSGAVIKVSLNDTSALAPWTRTQWTVRTPDGGVVAETSRLATGFHLSTGWDAADVQLNASVVVAVGDSRASASTDVILHMQPPALAPLSDGTHYVYGRTATIALRQAPEMSALAVPTRFRLSSTEGSAPVSINQTHAVFHVRGAGPTTLDATVVDRAYACRPEHLRVQAHTIVAEAVMQVGDVVSVGRSYTRHTCKARTTLAAADLHLERIPAADAAHVAYGWHCVEEVESSGWSFTAPTPNTADAQSSLTIDLDMSSAPAWQCNFRVENKTTGATDAFSVRVVRVVPAVVEPGVVHVTSKDSQAIITLPDALAGGEGTWVVPHPLTLVAEGARSATVSGFCTPHAANFTVKYIPRLMAACPENAWLTTVVVHVAPPAARSGVPAVIWTDMDHAEVVDPVPVRCDEESRFEPHEAGAGCACPVAAAAQLTPGTSQTVVVRGMGAGECVPLTRIVSNDAGEARGNLLLRRCTTVDPALVRVRQTRVQSLTIVAPLVADPVPAGLVGRWECDAGTVDVADPSEPHMATVSGLPRAHTTCRWHVEAVGEESRPAALCPARSVTVSVSAVASACPPGVIQTCSEHATIPLSAGAAGSVHRVVRCDNATVKAAIVEGAGGAEVQLSGLPVGEVICNLTTSAAGMSGTSVGVQECRVSIRRRAGLQAPHFIDRVAAANVEGHPLTFSASMPRAAGELLPASASWRIVPYAASGAELPVLTLADDPRQAPGDESRIEFIYTLPRAAAVRYEVSLTVRDSGDVCPPVAASTTVHVAAAIVDERSVLSCGNAVVSAQAVPPALATTVVGRWSFSSAQGCGSAVIEHPTAPRTAVLNLPRGHCELKWRVESVAHPTVAATALVTIHTVVDDAPRHGAHYVVTSDTARLRVSAHSAEWGIVQNPPPSRGRPPATIARITETEIVIHGLQSGPRYSIVYRPVPIATMGVDVSALQCPPRVLTVTRADITFVGSTENLDTECDAVRGEGHVVISIEGEGANVSFIPDPTALQLALRRANSNLTAPWWVGEDVDWGTPMYLDDARRAIKFRVRARRFLDAAAITGIDMFDNVRVPTAVLTGLSTASGATLPVSHSGRSLVPIAVDDVRVRVSAEGSAERSREWAFRKYLAHPIDVTETELAMGLVGWNATATGCAIPRAPIESTNFGGCPFAVEGLKSSVARGRCVTKAGPHSQVQLAATVKPKTDFTINRETFAFLRASKFALCGVEPAKGDLGPSESLQHRQQQRYVPPRHAPQEPHWRGYSMDEAARITKHLHELRRSASRPAAAMSEDAGDLSDRSDMFVTVAVLRILPETDGVQTTAPQIRQCAVARGAPAFDVTTGHGFFGTSPTSTAVEVEYNTNATDEVDREAVRLLQRSLRPQLHLINSRRMSITLQPVPGLQIRAPISGVSLLLRAPGRYFNGVSHVDAVWPLRVTASRATLTLDFGAAQRDALCEHDLKARGATFRVTLEGDVWDAAVGNGDANGFNVALINGLYSASHAQLFEGGATPQQVPRGLASPFLTYAADILRPEHVVRLSDTIVELRLPPCTAALGAAAFERCRRVTDVTSFGPVEEIAFAVPGIATACDGCLVAHPYFNVYGTATSVQLSLRRDGTQISLPSGTGNVTAQSAITTVAQDLLPLDVYLHARCGSWNEGLAANVQSAAGALTLAPGEGTPAAIGAVHIINSTIVALTLVGSATAAQAGASSAVKARVVVRPEWLVADRAVAAMLTPTAARNLTVQTRRGGWFAALTARGPAAPNGAAAAVVSLFVLATACVGGLAARSTMGPHALAPAALAFALAAALFSPAASPLICSALLIVPWAMILLGGDGPIPAVVYQGVLLHGLIFAYLWSGR